MTNAIQISSQIKASNVNANYSNTVVLVGQATTANTGIFTDIELKSNNEINTLFGAGSHLSMILREAVNVCNNNGFTKPKVMAISYPDDVSGDVAKIISLELTGTTATESKILKIIFNRHNASRYSALISTLFASKVTNNTDISKYFNLGLGSPKLASKGYCANLTTIYDNDLIIDVEVLKGETISQIATKINTAINNTSTCTFSSTVSAGVLTLTAKNKGLVSQEYTIEIDNTTIPAGITTTITQTTEGTGTIDISNILNLTKNNIKLDNMKFKYIAIPYGWNDTNLVINAKQKYDNVLQYNNQALDYRIIKTSAVDCSNIANIDTFASNNPKSEDGLNKIVFVLNKISNLKNKAIIGLDIYNKLDFYNLTGIAFDNYDEYSVHLRPVRTLSSVDTLKDLPKLITISIIREVFVERLIPRDFTGNENYTDGTGDQGEKLYDKAILKSIFLNYCNYFYLGSDSNNQQITSQGIIPASVLSGQFAGMINDSETAKQTLEDVIDATLNYNSNVKEVRIELAFNLFSQIEKLTIINNIM